jgi:hypothetical protein
MTEQAWGGARDTGRPGAMPPDTIPRFWRSRAIFGLWQRSRGLIPGLCQKKLSIGLVGSYNKLNHRLGPPQGDAGFIFEWGVSIGSGS